MSRENVKKFFELVKTEEQLARKVVELNDGMRAGKFGDETQVIENQILPIAKEYDLDFTVEEFLAYSQEHAGELSDEMLMAVTGGFMSPRAMAIGLLATTAISFVPSIVGSFASGGEDAVPPVTETSISQTYDQGMDEDTVVDKPSFELEDSGLATPPNSPVFAVQGNTGAGGSGELNMNEVMQKLASLKADGMRAGADVTATETEAQSVNEDRDTTAAGLHSAYVVETETATTEVKAADEVAAVEEQKVDEKEFEMIDGLEVPTEVFDPFLKYLRSNTLGFVEEAELPDVLEAIKNKIKEQVDHDDKFSVDMTNNTITKIISKKTYDLLTLLKQENISEFKSTMSSQLYRVDTVCAGTALKSEYNDMQAKISGVKTLSQAKEANAQLKAFLAKVDDIEASQEKVGVEPTKNETSALGNEVDTGATTTAWKKLAEETPPWKNRVEHVLQGIENYSNLDESSRKELDGEVEKINRKSTISNRIKSSGKVKYGKNEDEQAKVKKIRDFAKEH